MARDTAYAESAPTTAPVPPEPVERLRAQELWHAIDTLPRSSGWSWCLPVSNGMGWTRWRLKEMLA